MACDIIITIPWECGDRDCPVQWHLANYWIDDDSETGYSVDNYADGDHDLCEESDLPKCEEINKAWQEYYAYVAKTGCDPVGDFMIKRSIKKKERWEFRFSDSILGYVVQQARHAGKLVNPEQLPEHVRRYLNVPDKGRAVLGDFESDKPAFQQLFPKFWKWNVQYIEHEIPRDKALVERELKTAARKAMRRKNEPVR